MTTTAGNESSWIDALENPKSVTTLYVSTPQIVELLRVSIDREGPRADLIGRLDRFPDRPPPKWRGAGSNVAVITLRIEGLMGFQVASWSTTNAGRFSLSRTSSGVAFSFEAGDEVVLRGRAVVAHVVEFSHHFDPSLG